MIKTHPIYLNYSADELGNIYNKHKKILNPWINNKGYNQIDIKGKNIRCHRFVWECFNGLIPDKKVIDHINRNPLDNNITNLRCVTSSINNRNCAKKTYKGKKAACKNKGVYISAKGKYRAILSLGTFETEEEAFQVYNRATKLLGLI